MAKFICFVVFVSILFQNVIAIHNVRYGFAPELLHTDREKDSGIRSPKLIEPDAFNIFRHNARNKRSVKEADVNVSQPAKNDSSQASPSVSTDKLSSKTTSDVPSVDASKNQTQLVHNNITTMVCILHCTIFTIRHISFAHYLRVY